MAMAKTHKNLFPEIVSLESLYAAARQARRRKTRKENVERFELHRERFLRQLHDDLVGGVYRPSGYRQFQIFEPKPRLISAAPYRDRVVHHALCRVIGPLLERRFVYDSYSCRHGKGTEAARERCRLYTNRYRYVLKCDIRKYFPSIDHVCLMDKLAAVIGCRATLDLCALIIGSASDESEAALVFPGDPPDAASGRRRGLPIGNLTSQLWANLYLDRMDHWLKEDCRIPGYARYTDDFLLWSDDKSALRQVRASLSDFLVADRLLLHAGKTRIMPCAEGVPFLGFRFFPGLWPRLLGEAKRRFETRTRRQVAALAAGELAPKTVAASARGWSAFAAYGNTRGLFGAYRRDGFGQVGT
jgi:RNA-directed DNA polymerase